MAEQVIEVGFLTIIALYTLAGAARFSAAVDDLLYCNRELIWLVVRRAASALGNWFGNIVMQATNYVAVRMVAGLLLACCWP
ncbi:MAG TPA: hypothetical protein PK264_01270 [Hyphomicrobiaceae bacterium]|nr:hypothetical protein [Hyphomicrobiaceae bacterium]